MKTLNLITLLLVIIGGINWGLVGAFDFNLVSAIFGTDTFLANLIYILVGLSSLYQIYDFVMLANDRVPHHKPAAAVP